MKPANVSQVANVPAIGQYGRNVSPTCGQYEASKANISKEGVRVLYVWEDKVSLFKIKI